MKTVYLAGPIAGLTYGGCTSWREYATEQFAQVAIKALSPMRAKEYLKKIALDTPLGNSDKSYGYEHPLSLNRGIMTRDRWDATRCDVLLANFADGALDRVSIGTCMEVAWADLRRIPVVAVLPENNLHAHAMIDEAIGFRVDTLRDAIDIVKALLL